MMPLTRSAIVAEAKSWLGTPYHLQARVRGAGVDCINLLIGVAEAFGLVPQVLPAMTYSPQWCLHGDRAEMIVEGIQQSALFDPLPVEAIALADVVGFRFRPRMPISHVGIISHEAPLRMIHAAQGHKVLEVGVTGRWRATLAAAWRWRALQAGA